MSGDNIKSPEVKDGNCSAIGYTNDGNDTLNTMTKEQLMYIYESRITFFVFFEENDLIIYYIK